MMHGANMKIAMNIYDFPKLQNGFSRARRYRRSQCYGGISACCAGVRFTVEKGTKLTASIPTSTGKTIL
jgi:hypothetical protein